MSYVVPVWLIALLLVGLTIGLVVLIATVILLVRSRKRN